MSNLTTFYSAMKVKLVPLDKLYQEVMERDIKKVVIKSNPKLRGLSLPALSCADFLNTMKLFGFKEKRIKKHYIIYNETKTLPIKFRRTNTVHPAMLAQYLKEVGISRDEFVMKYHGVTP